MLWNSKKEKKIVVVAVGESVIGIKVCKLIRKEREKKSFKKGKK